MLFLKVTEVGTSFKITKSKVIQDIGFLYSKYRQPKFTELSSYRTIMGSITQFILVYNNNNLVVDIFKNYEVWKQYIDHYKLVVGITLCFTVLKIVHLFILKITQFFYWCVIHIVLQIQNFIQYNTKNYLSFLLFGSTSTKYQT